jgi:predicted nucleic acid-binding protein
LSATDATHALAHHVLSRIEREGDPLHGVFSVVSVTEALVRPMLAGRTEEMYVHAFLTSFPHLTGLNVDFAVAHDAARIRADHRLKTPDALIVAAGMRAGCDAVVSNDREWLVRLQSALPACRWIYLPDHL